MSSGNACISERSIARTMDVLLRHTSRADDAAPLASNLLDVQSLLQRTVGVIL